MSDWQPIETAPRDGRYIWVYRPEGKIDPWITPPRVGTDRWTGRWLWIPAGWENSAPIIQPTHWMPLEALCPTKH
jgi:hypothetical protein